ncbi:LAETG motif-containing sortase-dependent surface protein [Kitasatospora sp. NRRL B-11411]|uniref:LAETG motif-containing sortase-dependent surface protein n=1 Tax=Kitasatospora sp. NRRL B-11411 TaxID=1463822 RepID=UPI00068F0EB3|nr:LAETG motif-containing sortase-dependent surface protein [Kitasatospora sp. NRRL B-11411]
MSVRTRRARLATFAAVVVLGATVPVLTGTSSAWACGDVPAAGAAAANTPAAQPVAEPQLRVDAATGEKSITAGGAPVEFTVKVSSSGPGPIKDVTPFPSFFNKAGDSAAATLLKQDLALQVKTAQGWKDLALFTGCDPVLHADYSSLKADYAPGDSHSYTFRLFVTAHADPAQTQVDVSTGLGNVFFHAGYELTGNKSFVLPIVHPTAPTSPAPSASAPSTKAPTSPAPSPSTKAPAAPAASASPTAVPAAAVSSAAASPSAAPVAANLASTGGGSSSAPMLIGGTALVLLGAGAVVFARRRTAAARD